MGRISILLKKIAAAMLLCLIFMQVSLSAEPAILVDGSVKDLNPRVYDALLKLKQAAGGSGVLCSQAAQFLSQEIVADQQMDTAETDLLVELTQDKSRLIRIYSKNAPAESVTFGTAFGSARQVLREVVLPQKTLDGLLTNGADGLKQLALLSDRSPADAIVIQAHLQQYITSVWGQSNLDNKYEPIRDLVKRSDSDLKTLPEAVQKQSQALLYEAFLQADAKAGDVIPAVFYSCLK